MSAAAFQHAEFECADAATLVSLNAVVLSAAHLKTTKRVMAEMPAPAWIDPLTREPALRGLARAAGFGDDAKIGAALYERVTALATGSRPMIQIGNLIWKPFSKQRRGFR